MPGYDQPTKSSSRKAVVEKPPSATRHRPESPAGQAHARESSVYSDIGPSLTIKQRSEAQQQDTRYAGAEPEHPASPTTKTMTRIPSLKKSLAHHDQPNLMSSIVSASEFSKNLSSASTFPSDLSKNISSAKLPPTHSSADLSSATLPSVNSSSKNGSSASIFSSDWSRNPPSPNLPLTDSSKSMSPMTGGANNQNLDRLLKSAFHADVEGVKQPNKNTELRTLGHSAELAKEEFEPAGPATVATRPEPWRFQPNMSPPAPPPSPPTPGRRPRMTMGGSPSRLIASRAAAVVKQYASLTPPLPIRVSASPSSTMSPPTPGRKCMWCGGREHASVDCDKVCTQCGSSSHTKGGCRSSSGF